MQAVQHLFRQILTLLLLLATVLALLAVLLLQRTPLLSETGQLNAAAVRNSQQLFNNLNQSMRDPGQQLVIQTNADELNAAFALASRTLPGFQGKTQINPAGLTILMTMPLDLLSYRLYINADIQIEPSAGPLQVRQVQLGRLTLPGDMALGLLGWVADQLWGPGEGAALLAKVRSVTVQQDAVKVELSKSEGFSLSQLKSSGVSLYKQWFGSDQQTALIEHYYALALAHSQQQATTQPSHSLISYLQVLMREADRRSKDAPEQAVRENQAVILALAQLLGGRNLQLLVNEVKTNPQGKPPRVTLARRPDLQQHFVYSASLHVLGNQRLSSAVGEAKELLDSLNGGSGFSFVDLLADRAGIRFARLAVASAQSARAVQQFFTLQDRTEQELFPNKSRLPEGLPQAMFEQQYQSIDSAVYQQMVAEIDRRLNALPLYQIKP
ncbi:hypothetical protein [Rheinheimera sp. F8]|uniref:hypothetical protein n=1 Tax=Rheinheimera sp. F8 TaxID=1763998 RepID=UPI000744AE97|nr:hypothetical protein [Rheinheimera sp. F8]ALZ75921.1 hypothetical protein ATY27_09190 [Rheinheimera sp. F8]